MTVISSAWISFAGRPVKLFLEARMDRHMMAIQVRAARAALKWKQAELARRAGISEPAINRLERGENEPRYSTFMSVLSAFREAGVVFDEAPKRGITMFLDTNLILATIRENQENHGSNDNV